MIGQSLINVSNGARARLSGIVAAIMLLIFIMFGANLVEKLPMAALTGLMIMVAIGTFEWASLRTFNRMPKSDIFVMIFVTLVTYKYLFRRVLLSVTWSTLFHRSCWPHSYYLPVFLQNVLKTGWPGSYPIALLPGQRN